ncbi:MAG: hypothetical protein Q4C04_01920 [Clostridia bacterium]|nr:hypothetical protein [Clostridia bacterium]
MEKRALNLVHTEQSHPERKRIRSDGVLYFLLLASVLFVIWACNRFSDRLPLPTGYVQLILYVILLIGALVIIRYRLTGFRYTLTDEAFYVDKIVGRRESNLLAIPLGSLSAVSEYERGVKSPRLYCGKRKNAVRLTADGRDYLLSISPELKEKLVEYARKMV